MTDEEAIAFLVEHHLIDEVLIRHPYLAQPSQIESAIQRLIRKTARKLGFNQRLVIESEAESVDSVVASELVAESQRIVSSNFEQAISDQLVGRHRALPRAAANNVHDLGRKLKRRKLPRVAEEAGYEVAGYEDKHEELPEPSPEVAAALARMEEKGTRPTLANLAKELGYSRQYLHRLRKKKAL